MKIIINGASGRMGQNLYALINNGASENETVACVGRSYITDAKEGKYHSLSEVTCDADAVIDFSNHSTTKELLDFCLKRSMPAVIATTGQTDEEKMLIQDASEKIPVFLSANMSVGIAVLCDLVKRAATTFPDADIEIIERHHNQKLDVPSGTALLIADGIKEIRTDACLNIGRSEHGKRRNNEIGIHSLRYGNEVGTHEIILSTGNETISLKHEAESRMLFAEGALRAAEFLVKKKPGLYTMRDLF